MHLINNDDPHAAFTAGITISASGSLLPLFAVTTEAMENQLQPALIANEEGRGVDIRSSARSCMPTSIMIEYLHQIRSYFDGTMPSDGEEDEERILLREAEEYSELKEQYMEWAARESMFVDAPKTVNYF